MTTIIPLYPHPILLLENSNEEKYLVITDIHIGYKENNLELGVLIEQKKIIEEMLDLLISIANENKIKNLIILGDLKSSTKIITKVEWKYVRYFLSSLSTIYNIYLIPGNHDGNLNYLIPNNTINLISAKGMELYDTLLTHGHTIPKIGENINKIITGHLHPRFIKDGSILNGQKVWIRIILERSIKNHEKDVEFIVIPQFDKNINYFENKSRGKTKLPLLNNLILKKNWKISQAFIISLDGSIMGSKDELNMMIQNTNP